MDTTRRLTKEDLGIAHTGEVIKAMIEDVEREAEGEIVKSREARTAIGKRTAQMFKNRVKNQMRNCII